MNKILVNTKGENLNSDTNSPHLEITWHKAFNEIYCHNVNYKFPKPDQVVNLGINAKITIKQRINNIEKGKVKSYSDKEIVRFLPIKIENDFVNIPLHSIEIIDALCNYEYTSLKDGKRGATKSYPLDFIIEVPSMKLMVHSFNAEYRFFPYTLSEKYFNDLKEGEKFIINIYFS